VRETTNPSLSNHELYTLDDQEKSQGVMQRECNHLLNEIQRLEHSRVMQDHRVQNVMDLASIIIFVPTFLVLLIRSSNMAGVRKCQYQGQQTNA